MSDNGRPSPRLLAQLVQRGANERVFPRPCRAHFSLLSQYVPLVAKPIWINKAGKNVTPSRLLGILDKRSINEPSRLSYFPVFIRFLVGNVPFAPCLSDAHNHKFKRSWPGN